MIIIGQNQTLTSTQAEEIRSIGLGYLLEEAHYLRVPKEGWTLKQIKEVVRGLGMPCTNFVVIEAAPVLLGMLCRKASEKDYSVWVFHGPELVWVA